MRYFEDIAHQLGLKHFLASPSGTLYFVPRPASDDAATMVRRFDGALPPSSIPAYIDLARAAQAWIERHSTLAARVRVDQPIEAGADFVARRHHYYHVSLSSYDDPDDDASLPTPDELRALRAAFTAVRGQSTDERDRLIEEVLARGILPATAKTFFEPAEDRFVIVELTPTADELIRWAALNAS
jgi:hypothetical protein